MKTQRIKKLEQPLVGQLVRELRQLLNLTQEEFANSLEVSFSSISRWERGADKYTDKCKFDYEKNLSLESKFYS